MHLAHPLLRLEATCGILGAGSFIQQAAGVKAGLCPFSRLRAAEPTQEVPQRHERLAKDKQLGVEGRDSLRLCGWGKGLSLARTRQRI